MEKWSNKSYQHAVENFIDNKKMIVKAYNEVFHISTLCGKLVKIGLWKGCGKYTLLCK